MEQGALARVLKASGFFEVSDALAEALRRAGAGVWLAAAGGGWVGVAPGPPEDAWVLSLAGQPYLAAALPSGFEGRLGGLPLALWERLLSGAWAETEAGFLDELLVHLGRAGGTEELAEGALRALQSALGAESVGLFFWRQGRFVLSAFAGDLSPAGRARLRGGLAPGEGLLWRVFERGEPVFVTDYPGEPGALSGEEADATRSLALVPVGRGRRPRIVLAVRERRPHRWTAVEERLLRLASRLLTEAFDRLALAERLATFLRLGALLPEVEESEFYHQVLKAAVELVPGAEAGSLLVKEGRRYRYRAAVGYDLGGLVGVEFDEAAMRDWGGPAWDRGEPRVISRRERPLEEVSYKTAPRSTMDRYGRVRELAAVLTLPIRHKGSTLAALNLDAFSDPLAFDDASLEVARGFAVEVAAMLHEAELRRSLEQAALTDPLTGLSNRRAFDRELKRVLARADREGKPFALAVMDLAGFKRVNDRFGHAGGDQALYVVAQAMGAALRSSDRLFRWGGDEFALILPGAGPEEAEGVASRIKAAVASVCLEDLCLGVHLGLAFYPRDGRDASRLLQVADRRMYLAKAADADPNGGVSGVY